MTSGNEQELRPGEEEALLGLLREMEPVSVPSPEVTRRIRQAVAAEWRSAVAGHRAAGSRAVAPRRRALPALALAASLATVVVTTWVLFRAPAEPPVVATLGRVTGAVESGAGSDWLPVNAGQPLAAGRELVTGPGGRALLNLQHGVTLRLDTDTRVTLAGIDRIIIRRGGVYLDSGPNPDPGDPVRVETPFGDVRHLGTQYEVRVAPEQMQVAIREGRVEVTGAPHAGAARPAPVVAVAGEQLVLKGSGDLTRSAVPRRDPRWNWIGDVTPPFAIEQRRLTDFLTWVCRETGRDLRFASPQVEAAAGQVILRGSVAGLTPDAALAAVMATTSFAYSDADGALTIGPVQREAALR